MGLLEKRGIAAFQDNKFSTIEADIKKLSGFDIAIEVHWDKLAINEYAHLYEEGFTKVYFIPIINAFTEITKDNLGKDALKETLHKIIITNENDNYSFPTALSFDANILTIDHSPISNIDNIDDRSNELTSFLMKLM